MCRYMYRCICIYIYIYACVKSGGAIRTQFLVFSPSSLSASTAFPLKMSSLSDSQPESPGVVEEESLQEKQHEKEEDVREERIVTSAEPEKSDSSSSSSRRRAERVDSSSFTDEGRNLLSKRKGQVKDTIFCSPGTEDGEDFVRVEERNRDGGRQDLETQKPPRATVEEALEKKLATLSSSACVDELVAVSFDETTCSLSLEESLPFEGDSLDARFDRLGKLAVENFPRIFLLRLDVESNSPEWAVISWTPAAVCSPCRRTFVDYAAWFLRISLRFSRPVKEYYASKKELLTVEAFRRAQRQACRVQPQKPRADDFCLSYDRILPPRLSALESGQAKSPVSPQVPLTVDNSFSEQLEEFRKGEIACIEIFIDDEDSTLVALPCIHDTPALLQQHVTDGRPRYFLLRYEDSAAFIFFAAAESRRDCVLYAAFKQRALDLILKCGVQVSNRYEIRCAEDLPFVLGEAITRSPGASRCFDSNSLSGSASLFVGVGEQPAEMTKENFLVLLAMLPAKAPPPGDGWQQTAVLPAAQDTLEAWQVSAAL
ncbi:hypothetical protein TGME49_282090 [Toxoplasma gondii ME49]|uniref:Uncharacterized protein n=1 Tax=Toxoplasma gondii (strain ATCC 50611 / Me49) TaxID=508771 RepID=S8GEX3_TOXGM|nr:hypothetical protein TGME49_282090 [Toxoplasma gondii ME49]EPT30370.1 hypothetical protein TGME49_282090 [Toxoplasma gondii ME49]|eukprot:XP_018637467.1 hypothetical protein TGME49_282090 [Toxoplasma gondii ME49]